jgi:stage V sporulation protein G
MENVKFNARVYPINEAKGNTVAFASITVADLIAVRGIRIVKSEKGLFVTMPQSRGRDGKYHDIAFPLNAELRREINAAVLDEYDRIEKSGGGQFLHDMEDI